MLPHRAEKQDILITKNDYKTIINRTQNIMLFTYWPADMVPDSYYGKRILTFPAMFYITAGRQIALKTSSEIEKGGLFLAKARDVVRVKGIYYHILYQFKNDNNLIWLIGVK